MNAAFQGSFSRRHDAHLVSLIRPVTIPYRLDTNRFLAAGVSSQTLLAAKILCKGLPGLMLSQLDMTYRLLRLTKYQAPPGEMLRAPLHPM